METKKELEALLKEIAGKDIAITVGPGGHATLMPETTGSDGSKGKVQKDVQDMKDFMGKTVEQLAAGSKESQELQIIDVRDRKLVVQKAPGRSRSEAIMIACLYAANNQGVDSVLKQMKAQGHFQMENGTVQIQPIIPPKEEGIVASGVISKVGAWEESKVKEAAPDEDVKRNILVGEDEEPEKEILVNEVVVIRNTFGDPVSMGTVITVKDKECEVLDMHKNQTYLAKWRLMQIKPEDAPYWAARVVTYLAEKLKGNND